MPVGERRYVSGTAALYDGMLQMVHPDRVVDEAGLAKLPLVEPVYPLTEGLAPERRCARRSTARWSKLPSCPNGRTRAWLAREQLPVVRRRAAAAASPARAGRCRCRKRRPVRGSPTTNCWPASSRLRWCARILRRPAGRVTRGDGRLRKKIIAALPYSLTPSQTRAVDDIVADLAKPERMLRLLQGDVGSGKTVVALLAAAAVIEAGRQAALMAPTEILARQHLATITPLAEAAGIRVAILTGRERGRERSDDCSSVSPPARSIS